MLNKSLRGHTLRMLVGRGGGVGGFYEFFKKYSVVQGTIGTIVFL